MAMMSGNGNGNGRGRGRGRGGHVPMSEINVTPMVDVMLVLLLVVSVNAGGEVFLQETKITLEQLVPRLEAITQNKKDTRIFVRGDAAIAYGKVMEVMGTVNLAGFTRVALLTELPKGNGAGGAK